MNPHIRRAAEIEETFLAGAEANLNQARERRLRGTRWTWTTRSQEDRLREWMRASGRHDRNLFEAMPKNRSRVLTGTEPRFLFGRRRSSVAIASAFSPLPELLAEEADPPQVGLAELVAHVKELVGQADVPHVVGVCSPGGFTEDARHCGLELPNVTLVLAEPRPDGGWTTTPVSPDATEEDAGLFDPEATAQKIARVVREIETHRADLLTGGIRAASLARRLDLPEGIVAAAFGRVQRDDPELKLSRKHGDLMLFRGAPGGLEDGTMSMMDYFRRLLGGEGNVARKIDVLSERRARLDQRRERFYEDLSRLEQREGDLITQGRESASPSAKRRIASQIKQLRNDMQRLNATAGVLGKQIDVISTHIHNLTLIQQGHVAELPSTEEITTDAARAEEMLEQLTADAEMTDTLSVGISEDVASEEEMDILRELESPADQTAPSRERRAKESPAADAASEQEPPAAPRREREPG
jgi:hypothetical protein